MRLVPTIFMTFSLSAAALATFAPMAAEATPKHCPPGHAKKGWCVPGERTYRHAEKYRRIEDYQRYRLPPPRDGAVYGEIDGEVYLILEATREIIEGVGAAAWLLNRQ